MSQIGNFLNLQPHMSSWRVYTVGGPYTTDYSIGALAPATYGGLSYRILDEKGNDVYIIKTGSFGLCAIWAPRDADSTITTSPSFSNGDVSSTANKNTLLNYASNNGLFKGLSLTIADFNYQTSKSVISLTPLITLNCEVGLVEKLVGPYNFINLSASSTTVSTSLSNSLNSAGIKFNGLNQNLKLSLDKLFATGNISSTLKYTVEYESNDVIKITFEATMLSYNNINMYQRAIIRIYRNSLRFATAPVPATSTQTIQNQLNFNLSHALIFTGIVVGGILLGVAGFSVIEVLLLAPAL